jgi:predicted  nucleic acid-binding Zn-ribbon protein
MDTPLITKVKTLHRALIKMAVSMGITDLPSELSDPKSKMSEIVHQMNNIYANIASVLSGHNETQQSLIADNNFLKEKLSDILKNGENDISRLNQKLVAGEVWWAQISSQIENFSENPVDALKYMSDAQKTDLRSKLHQESDYLDSEIENSNRNITQMSQTHISLSSSYKTLLLAAQSQSSSLLQSQSNISLHKSTIQSLSTDITSTSLYNKKLSTDESNLKNR